MNKQEKSEIYWEQMDALISEYDWRSDHKLVSLALDLAGEQEEFWNTLKESIAVPDYSKMSEVSDLVKTAAQEYLHDNSFIDSDGTLGVAYV